MDRNRQKKIQVTLLRQYVLRSLPTLGSFPRTRLQPRLTESRVDMSVNGLLSAENYGASMFKYDV
jgi:hypothetical protein